MIFERRGDVIGSAQNVTEKASSCIRHALGTAGCNRCANFELMYSRGTVVSLRKKGVQGFCLNATMKWLPSLKSCLHLM